MTDTNHETRGFPKIEPLDAPPEMARFMTAMRRLQDIAVSTAPGGTCGRTRPSASRTCAVAWKLQAPGGLAHADRIASARAGPSRCRHGFHRLRLAGDVQELGGGPAHQPDSLPWTTGGDRYRK